MNTKKTEVYLFTEAPTQAELRMRLFLVIPMKALDNIIKQHAFNPETVECTNDKRKEILADVVRLNPDWVTEVVEQRNDYKLSDVLHDFHGIYSEDEHFLPRIQPATPEAPPQELDNVSKYRQIKVKYLGATNTRGSRVCIYEPKRYNNGKTDKVLLPYCSTTGCIQKQAFNYLVSKGFNIVAKASGDGKYIFLADNWADELRVTPIE